MSVDTDLATACLTELDRVIKEATESLANGLPYDQYQQACGMIVAYKQVRYSLIPETLEAIQRR